MTLDWVATASATDAIWNALLGWAALLVLALALLVGYVEYRRLKLENGIAELRAEIEGRRKSVADEASRRSDPAFEKAVRDHNEIVTVLMAIERVPLEEVQVDEVTMRPDVPEFRIDARAPTATAAQRYLAALNESDPGGNWTIVQIKSLARAPGFAFSVTSLKRQARGPATVGQPSK